MGNSSTLTDDEIQKKQNKGNCIINFPFSPALPSCSIFDIIPPQSDDHQKSSSSSFAGYIDLLSTNDFTVTSSSTLLDWFPNTAFDADDTSPPPAQINQLPLPSPAVSDVFNTNPATPISVSSSISSSSNEACVANKPIVPVAGNEHELELLEEEAKDKDEDHAITHVENQNQDRTIQTKKLVKGRKKKKKSRKERATRVSFKTKSDVDHLDDGYRWRKYGQKPVKNSPYPRSYYRCTTAGCGVKKRLERSAMEPSFVLTSYEGQHTHFSPILTRAAELGFVTNASSFHDKNYQHRNTLATQSQPQHFQHFHHQPDSSSSLFNNSYNIAPPFNVVNSAHNFINQDNYAGSSSHSSCLRINLRDLVSDDGLLQDMIAPKEMAGAGAAAGEGRIDGDVTFMLG